MNRHILRMFKRGNVIVVGERGAGKDLLLGNVYNRIKRPYVSNQDYGGYCVGKYNPFLFNMNGNTYRHLLEGNVYPYEYPYEKGTDVIISDAGIYFPSQYCNELNRDYKGQPMFAALSRQIGRCNVHCNTQAYGRLWDKQREQAFRYIQAERCVVILGLVIQEVIVYDKAESCQSRVKPCRVSVPALGDKNAKMQARIYRDTFFNTYGTVKRYTLVYRNKSRHNTYQFERMFKREKSTYEEVDDVLRPRDLRALRRGFKRVGRYIEH